MKLASALTLGLATASATSPRLRKPSLKEEPASVGIFYGEPTPMDSNKTETVAKMIAAEIGGGAEATLFVKPYDDHDLTRYDSIVVGSPTYNSGAWNYRSTTDWDDWLYDELPGIDLADKKVAIFGTGNSFFPRDFPPRYYSGYGDMFGDALGEIYDRFAEAGCQMYGFTIPDNDFEREGFNFTRSKFIRNGMFMGQMFDQYQEIQKARSPDRAKKWVEQLRNEGFFVKGTSVRQKFPRFDLPRVAAKDDHDSHEHAGHDHEGNAAVVGVFYGEPTPRHHAGRPDSNRTEAVAKLIAAEAGVVAIFFEKPYDRYDFDAYDAVIVGAPTYNTGAAERRSGTAWDEWLYCDLPRLDFSNKNVAVFGSGKGWYPKYDDETGALKSCCSGYGDNFGDAMGELYDRFAEGGAMMFGFVPENHDLENGGYNYTKSKFVRNGMFMGMMFDQKSQEELSPGRARDWVRQLREEGFFVAQNAPPIGRGFNEPWRPYPEYCPEQPEAMPTSAPAGGAEGIM